MLPRLPHAPTSTTSPTNSSDASLLSCLPTPYFVQYLSIYRKQSTNLYFLAAASSLGHPNTVTDAPANIIVSSKPPFRSIY